MGTAIIIGYGNELFGDDGIGPLIAKVIQRWRLPCVQSLAVHQLTPELAEPIANSRLAIFVDTCINSLYNQVQVQSLLPSPLNYTHTHSSDPQSLLTLSQFLYGNCPSAWLVIVPGEKFQLGDPISPLGKKAIGIALNKITQKLDTLVH